MEEGDTVLPLEQGVTQSGTVLLLLQGVAQS